MTLYVDTTYPASLNRSVTVTAPDGCTSYDEINLNFVICDGTEDPDLSPVVYAWPNPGPGIFSVRVTDPSVTTYSVYDPFGRKLIAGALNGTGEPCRIDLSAMPGGIYFLTFSGAKKLPSLKLVKY